VLLGDRWTLGTGVHAGWLMPGGSNNSTSPRAAITTTMAKAKATITLSHDKLGELLVDCGTG
jgi:hypothetical protein